MGESLNLPESLLVTLIGMMIVFLGLTVLIFMIVLLSRITQRLGQRKPKAQPRQAPSVKLPPPMPAPAGEPEPEQDGALVAAITAAIALMLESEGAAGGAFTVRRIRRVSQQPAWARAGREEQISSRF